MIISLYNSDKPNAPNHFLYILTQNRKGSRCEFILCGRRAEFSSIPPTEDGAAVAEPRGHHKFPAYSSRICYKRVLAPNEP